jgi:hypothetical protein
VNLLNPCKETGRRMMIYVVILVVVGLAGIWKLWTAQRRASAGRYSLDAHETLKRLSSRPTPGTVAGGRTGASPPSERKQPAAALSSEERAAAKRRLEARRRGRAGYRGRKMRAGAR